MIDFMEHHADRGCYPGTDMIKRLCWHGDCGELIEKLEDVWVDVDSNCCVCPKHKDTSCERAVDLLGDNVAELNELDEG